MKEYFVNNSINLIKTKYNYDNDMIDRIKYGLEIIYINITKISAIFIISFIFNLLKETIIFCLFINALRMFSYGLHAKKSWHCYVSSTFVFILMPYVFTHITFALWQKYTLGILSMISMVFFAPADTKKRPIINKRHRTNLKIISCVLCFIYMCLSILINNKVLSNLILLSLLTQSFIINPIIYKLFGLSYNNYKDYLKNGVLLHK